MIKIFEELIKAILHWYIDKQVKKAMKKDWGELKMVEIDYDIYNWLTKQIIICKEEMKKAERDNRENDKAMYFGYINAFEECTKKLDEYRL